MENKTTEKPANQFLVDCFTLLRRWKFIILWCFIGAIVGIFVAISAPKEYTVMTKLAPETVRKTSSSLSSLAGMAGINLGSLNTTDAITPLLYPTIEASTPFLVDLFSTPVEFTADGEKVNSDLYDYFKNYQKTAWWDYVMTSPFRLLGWVKGLFSKAGDPVEGYENVDPANLTKEQSMIAKAIARSIVTEVDKKYYVVTINAKAQDPCVAETLASTVVTKLQEYVTDYHTQKARKDLDYYQKLYDEAQEEYYQAQSRYAHHEDANQGLVLQSRRMDGERLRNEASLKYQVYNSCAQQLQNAKAKVQLDSPAFAVIYPATRPLKPSAPSKMKILFGFILVFCAGSIAWILCKDSIVESVRRARQA